MSDNLRIECDIHFKARSRGRKEFHAGAEPEAAPPAPGRIPRVARLMALAIRLDELVRTGSVANFAELAELGEVSRARITQITLLIHLAPDIQEQLLQMPAIKSGRDPIHLAQLQPIAATADWQKQRRMWAALRKRSQMEKSPGNC